MSWLSLLLFSICISLICMLMKQKKKETGDDDNDEEKDEMELNVPSGPLGLPFLGNILQLGNRPFETLFKWRSKYGSIFKIKLGSKTVVVLNGTKIIREALVERGDEFAGRPHLYMIHATLKGKASFHRRTTRTTMSIRNFCSTHSIDSVSVAAVWKTIACKRLERLWTSIAKKWTTNSITPMCS